eukprot:1145029-Pelagomonas_calceolata.AAC.5
MKFDLCSCQSTGTGRKHVSPLDYAISHIFPKKHTISAPHMPLSYNSGKKGFSQLDVAMFSKLLTNCTTHKHGSYKTSRKGPFL